MIEKPGDMLVFMAGYPAIYGVQPLYFKDPALMARSRLSPPDKSDTLKTRFNPSSSIFTDAKRLPIEEAGATGRVNTGHEHSIQRGATTHVRSSSR